MKGIKGLVGRVRASVGESKPKSREERGSVGR